ncbi:ABC transporter permease subunit [Pelagicoccus sp. SDUM812003]|uniref:ABC transporter permease subunit n=1 Tax=Pelagicoccus sp. SDUM812003 TaxID=3041267 RepID=UPI00280C9F9C|nr:ABC transporter permease subunit [Pelagicoccus sp. SDUM812003]MDQ8205169.1 ABC transporter permease subunit [Pelagicoccus sp. SDUM812003]
MNHILPIFKKEFLGYFRSPVGYVILAVFHLMVIGLALYTGYYRNNQATLDSIFSTLPWILIVFIPATGMRLWSEEKRSGSIELLFTLPISPRTAVLAKYLAALCFICIGLALTFSLAITTGYLGNPDWGVIFSGYIGGILTASAFLAITSVCSAMTKNQVIAFVISVMICLFATLAGSDWLARFLGDAIPVGMHDFLRLMSFEQHFQSMAKGLIDISALSFYITLTIACLGINIIAIER